ncbi:ComEC/Rec2 family competence protein [Asticcacaulis sp. EMRT-3]|uniref:ComEC/Rec2 family competence protein n=1 Tax=Asticcacaulis sp. EMRT-3 TaxID=3040349 RepID=UPI0024AEBBA8|nr:ComEC/Rec2 family competence protein [Asticcacaulis sp. EMRT-3]MDI7774544.1 ComEC/Rec2 family competence protein [Asticcacaulis sp. EMRT-3]
MKTAVWQEVGARATAIWQQQAGRLFLWFPVAFGFGAAAYLALPFEPALVWAVVPAILMGALLLAMWRWPAAARLTGPVVLIAFFAFGLAVAKLRTEHVRAPVLNPDHSTYRVQAFVIDNISPSADSPRLLLAPFAIKGMAARDVPLRLRVSLRPGVIAATGLKPGDAISVFAILNPPPEPSLPGGYDFARAAWFQGIGGVGLVPGAPEKIAAPVHGWRLDLILRLNRLRWNITQRLVESITPVWHDGGRLGGFAAALVTGQEAFVPQALIVDMRNSGLAHILSISGVHMAVVGGFIFFALRGLMAMIPVLALNAPIKKIAAALSMVCVLAYLAISGAPAPAVRSAVVACIAFTAIMLDRRALSLRALAIAALVVIALTPEAVVQPGFQMSFCATAALLALAEALQAPVSEISVPMWVKTIQSIVHGFWLSLVASLVATAATTPFAIAYFNRFSVYGLLSNLFESPITAFIVMPALALGTVLAATPLGPLLLNVAAGGLWLIAHIAAWTSALPQAVIGWPSTASYILPVSLFGVVWICLVRGPVRWLGLIAATAILWWPRLPVSDIWVDPDGGNAAIRIGHDAYVLRPKVRQFGYVQWTQRYGLQPLDADTRQKFYTCKGYACIPQAASPYRVGFWFSNVPPKPKVLDSLCRSSTLVVLRNPVGDWPQTCSGVNHISAGDFRRLGALELTRTQKGWAIRAGQPLRGQRYWSSPSDAELGQ